MLENKIVLSKMKKIDVSSQLYTIRTFSKLGIAVKYTFDDKYLA